MKKISNIIKRNLHILVLSAILILGFFLRSYQLSSNPVGFYCDEASIGYNAYSLFTTGKDEHGISYPLFFQAFGDYKTPIEIYSTIPSVAIFGLNEFSTRLPSVLFGLLTILVMLFLGEEMSANKRSFFGLLAAFIIATMPWLIHYNRVGFQLNSYCSFFVSTIYLFLKAQKQKEYLIPAFVVAAFTLYTYQSAELVIPLLIVGLVTIYRKQCFLYKQELATGLLVFFTLSIPLILSFFNGEGLARFNSVSLFAAKLSFSESLLRFIQNYFIQLSPSYFLFGEPGFITRHFTGGLTPLLIATLPFLIIGLLQTMITIKKKPSQVLLYWLFLYPLGGALTAYAPFTSRSIIGAPLCALFISIGIVITVSSVKKYLYRTLLVAVIIGFIFLNLAFFFRFYFVQYPRYSADYWGWQYGAKDIISYFVTQKNNYDELIMTSDFNSPEIFFKFYAPNDCDKCKIGSPDDYYKKRRKQLYALTPLYMKQHVRFHYQSVKKIYYPNGTVAFILTEITKNQ